MQWLGASSSTLHWTTISTSETENVAMTRGGKLGMCGRSVLEIYSRSFVRFAFNCMRIAKGHMRWLITLSGLATR